MNSAQIELSSTAEHLIERARQLGSVFHEKNAIFDAYLPVIERHCASPAIFDQAKARLAGALGLEIQTTGDQDQCLEKH